MVSGRSPAADFSSSFTSSSLLKLSLMRRTTEASFSAMRASLRRECSGNERLSRAKEWCRSLKSVTEGSTRPFSRSASIIDSMASPAEADDVCASETNARMRVRPLVEQWLRYAERVAGDSIVEHLRRDKRSSWSRSLSDRLSSRTQAAVRCGRRRSSLRADVVRNTNVGATGEGASNVQT
eukprot:5593182-Pleurochrysis_carterae.AAC.3